MTRLKTFHLLSLNIRSQVIESSSELLDSCDYRNIGSAYQFPITRSSLTAEIAYMRDGGRRQDNSRGGNECRSGVVIFRLIRAFNNLHLSLSFRR